jgi:hypothetical protein
MAAPNKVKVEDPRKRQKKTKTKGEGIAKKQLPSLSRNSQTPPLFNAEN